MAPRKRTSVGAGLPSPSPAKATRRAKAELDAKIDRVCATLGAETLMPAAMPKRVLEMLTAGAPHALAAPMEERHPLQERVLRHIQEVFDEAAKGLGVRLAEAQALVDGKNGELAAATAKVDALLEEIATAEKAIHDQQAVVEEKKAAVASAEQEQRMTEASAKANHKEQAGVAKQRDVLKAMQEGGLNALVESAFPTERDAQKACTKFVKDMERHVGAEQSLLASAPAVLLKPKDQRQGFDTMVIDSLRATLVERISALEATLAASEAAAKELETTLAAHTAAAEASRQERDSQAEALERMKAELIDKRGAKDAVEAEVETLRAAHAEKIGAAADAQEEVQWLSESRATLDALAARSLSLPAEAAEPAEIVEIVEAAPVDQA